MRTQDSICYPCLAIGGNQRTLGVLRRLQFDVHRNSMQHWLGNYHHHNRQSPSSIIVAIHHFYHQWLSNFCLMILMSLTEKKGLLPPSKEQLDSLLSKVCLCLPEAGLMCFSQNCLISRLSPLRWGLLGIFWISSWIFSFLLETLHCDYDCDARR